MENTRDYEKEFEKLVILIKEMRRHQKDYFKTKSKQSLAWAKGYEDKVDKLIESENNPKLF